MKKNFKNFLLSGYSIALIIILALCLYTRFYMSYTSTKDIYYKYSGIKYQCRNMKDVEPISIEINGKLTRECWQPLVGYEKYGEFDGTIKLGDKIFTNTTILFNKEKMASLDSDEGTYGTIYINDMFQKLTIQVLEPDRNNAYSWNDNTGWMISAPCNNRVEAVKVSNMLIKRLYHEIQ